MREGAVQLVLGGTERKVTTTNEAENRERERCLQKLFFRFNYVAILLSRQAAKSETIDTIDRHEYCKNDFTKSWESYKLQYLQA